MPSTLAGSVTDAILGHTFLRHVDHDHRGALDALRASPLDWILIACGRINDGPGTRHYHAGDTFTGGYKHVQVGDVAHALLAEVTAPTRHGQMLGIWE